MFDKNVIVNHVLLMKLNSYTKLKFSKLYQAQVITSKVVISSGLKLCSVTDNDQTVLITVLLNCIDLVTIFAKLIE